MPIATPDRPTPKIDATHLDARLQRLEQVTAQIRDSLPGHATRLRVSAGTIAVGVFIGLGLWSVVVLVLLVLRGTIR